MTKLYFPIDPETLGIMNQHSRKKIGMIFKFFNKTHQNTLSVSVSIVAQVHI